MENMQYFSDYFASSQHLDSIVFLGDAMKSVYGEININWNFAFYVAPSTTKMIVPCGKLAVFVASFNARPKDNWTSVNFYEAECLNTLTVLSSDVNLGNARSYSASGIIVSTPTNTSATYSGQAELIAIAKAGKVFTG
jgi:hypothetical protein